MPGHGWLVLSLRIVGGTHRRLRTEASVSGPPSVSFDQQSACPGKLSEMPHVRPCPGLLDQTLRAGPSEIHMTKPSRGFSHLLKDGNQECRTMPGSRCFQAGGAEQPKMQLEVLELRCWVGHGLPNKVKKAGEGLQRGTRIG